MYLTEREKLAKFIALRNKYIDMLEAGKLSKNEFNHRNNEIFDKINLRPFTVLDSFEKALYNYNYYNSKAKIELEEYKRLLELGKLKKAKLANNNKSNYYSLKDKSIEAMINLVDKSEIEAYYINLHSKNLTNTIFEIFFTKKERIILHTKNNLIKDLLISKGIFKNKIRTSLIDSYVNN